MNEKAIVIFNAVQRKIIEDIEIPLDISANDLVIALNSAYNLNIDIGDIKNCYLKAEKPIALLKGNKSLEEYGIRDGSVIYYTE